MEPPRSPSPTRDAQEAGRRELPAWEVLDPVLRGALEEDLGRGDVTTAAALAATGAGAGWRGRGRLLARADGVLGALEDSGKIPVAPSGGRAPGPVPNAKPTPPVPM